MVQDQSLPFIKYPVCLGGDCAGVVESIGSPEKSKFKVGDRVFGLSVLNGFQDYVVFEERMASKIPELMAFAEASVFPLCVSTSSAALFDKQYLGLPPPSLNPVSNGKSILIWGGSSGVGSNAIQLCKAAGFTVVTTCSRGNFDYVKDLGADEAFDYKSPNVIEDLVAKLDEGECSGIYNTAGSVAPACQVSSKSKQKIKVVSATFIQPEDVPEDVEAKFTFGTGGIEDFEPTIPITFGGFLADALSSGQYKIAPKPKVISAKGLEGIQQGLDIYKKGVSAAKVVVECES